MEEQKKKGVLKDDKRPKLLFGDEYLVACEDWDDGFIGWFKAKYMTSHAREMGWLWEIIDPKFRCDGEVHILDWKAANNERWDKK